MLAVVGCGPVQGSTPKPGQERAESAVRFRLGVEVLPVVWREGVDCLEVVPAGCVEGRHHGDFIELVWRDGWSFKQLRLAENYAHEMAHSRLNWQNKEAHGLPTFRVAVAETAKAIVESQP